LGSSRADHGIFVVGVELKSSGWPPSDVRQVAREDEDL